ncbi:hypothetical protein ACLB2K_027116 [Fragaria x ananassa]
MPVAGARRSKPRKEKKGVSRLGFDSHIQGHRKEEGSEEDKNIPFKAVVPARARRKLQNIVVVLLLRSLSRVDASRI